MSKIVIADDIAELARKVGKQFKFEQDLTEFSCLLKKMVAEAELDEYLGYPKLNAKGLGT
jgi:hypothetical protein